MERDPAGAASAYISKLEAINREYEGALKFYAKIPALGRRARLALSYDERRRRAYWEEMDSMLKRIVRENEARRRK